MGQYTGNAGQAAASHPTNVGERIIAFLRKRYPNKTADHVASEVAIPAATVAKWIERESVPNGRAVLKLIFAYGPEFLTAIYPNAPRWLNDAARAEQLAAIDQEFAALQKRREALR